MLPGRYELPVITASPAARDGYVEGCEGEADHVPRGW